MRSNSTKIPLRALHLRRPQIHCVGVGQCSETAAHDHQWNKQDTLHGYSKEREKKRCYSKPQQQLLNYGEDPARDHRSTKIIIFSLLFFPSCIYPCMMPGTGIRRSRRKKNSTSTACVNVGAQTR